MTPMQAESLSDQARDSLAAGDAAMDAAHAARLAGDSAAYRRHMAVALGYWRDAGNAIARLMLREGE